MSNNSQQKKIALITGANRGIGLEIARQLLLHDCFVVVTARNQKKGMEAVEKLSKINSSLSFIQMDVADYDSIKLAAQTFGQNFNRLDILINNAGILLDKKNILQLELDTLTQTVNANAIGAFLVIKEFLKFIPEGGRIINISSGVGQLSTMGTYAPAYAISKTMMNAITLQYANALRDKSIAVNSVCPGWVRTDMGGQNAERSVEKGAETPVWLALDAPISLTGKFLRDKKEIPW
ncbi:MAG: SDR family oxidoreductase [Ignavibacteria bacterium]|nr:SDR family oxidoreductase [Ignavibacteria bacterium]